MDAQCVEQVEQVDRTRAIGKRGVAGGDRERIYGCNMPGDCLVYAPFQRTQYFEINNPINTPIVFASMS